MTEFDYDVLAFGAHPDDVEISCGGTIRKLASKGYKIALVDMTQGELGTRGSVSIRQAESKAASEILGISHRENLSLPDGNIDGFAMEDPSNDSSQLSKVVSALRRLRPQLVLIGHGECRHPDHEASSKLVTRAVFFAGLLNYKIAGGSAQENKGFTARQLLYYSSRMEFRPSFVVDISAEVIAKERARHAYASQFGLDKKAGPTTLLSSPLMMSTMEAKDRYFGAMIGVSHGEPFLTRSALSISDPVSFFGAIKPDRAAVFPR